MGNAKSLPGIGEVVTAIESGSKVTAAGAAAALGCVAQPLFYLKDEKNPCFGCSGQLLHGAEKALTEYTDKSVIAGNVKKQICILKGDKEEAENIGDSVLDSLSGVLNNTPIVGHAKGAVHYLTGDEEKGTACMIGATRTVAVLAAGAATGGVGGGVVAAGFSGVGTGIVYDMAATEIDGKIHDEIRMHGLFSSLDHFKDTFDPNDLVDMTLTAASDFVTAAGAQRFVKNRQLKNQKQGSSQSPALTEEALPESSGNETNSVTQCDTQIEGNNNVSVIKGNNNVSVIEGNNNVSVIKGNNNVSVIGGNNNVSVIEGMNDLSVISYDNGYIS